MIDMSGMTRRERNKTLARLSAYARQLHYLCALPPEAQERFAYKASAWENNCRVLASKLGRSLEVDRENWQAVVAIAESHRIVVVPVRNGVPTPPWARPSDWRAMQAAKRRERADGQLVCY